MEEEKGQIPFFSNQDDHGRGGQRKKREMDSVPESCPESSGMAAGSNP